MKSYIVKIKGHQYRIKKGDKLDVEKIEGTVGDKISLDEVYLVSDDKTTDVKIGTPAVPEVKVDAKILEQFKDDKIEIVKFKKKNRYLKRQGHRQNLTKIEIL